MNREIKFRIYDKLEERYIYHNDDRYQGHYILSLDGKFTNLQNGSGGNDYIVQQYIGIKDSNGFDIYEGDEIIFEEYDYLSYNGAKSISGEVVFDKIVAGFKIKIKNSEYYYNFDRWFMNLKVIQKQ